MSAPAASTRELSDIAGAAEYLATTERHIRRLVYERRIPYIKLGSKVRFDRADLDAYVDAHRVPAEVAS